MSNLTFLTEEQCFGDEKLDILKKRGQKAAITDFAILTGGWVDLDWMTYLEGRTGTYWTKSAKSGEFMLIVDMFGKRDVNYPNRRSIGARLIQPFSSISSITTGETSKTPKMERDGVLEVEDGYYPQKAVSRDMQERLEIAFQRESLSRTGKNIQQTQEKLIKKIKCFCQSNMRNLS